MQADIDNVVFRIVRLQALNVLYPSRLDNCGWSCWETQARQQRDNLLQMSVSWERLPLSVHAVQDQRLAWVHAEAVNTDEVLKKKKIVAVGVDF